MDVVRPLHIGGWYDLKQNAERARAGQYQRRILSQLTAMVEFLVDSENSPETADRMEFAYQLRLATTGMSVWKNVEGLVYAYCNKFPVR